MFVWLLYITSHLNMISSYENFIWFTSSTRVLLWIICVGPTFLQLRFKVNCFPFIIMRIFTMAWGVDYMISMNYAPFYWFPVMIACILDQPPRGRFEINAIEVYVNLKNRMRKISRYNNTQHPHKNIPTFGYHRFRASLPRICCGPVVHE